MTSFWWLFHCTKQSQLPCGLEATVQHWFEQGLSPVGGLSGFWYQRSHLKPFGGLLVPMVAVVPVGQSCVDYSLVVPGGCLFVPFEVHETLIICCVVCLFFT